VETGKSSRDVKYKQIIIIERENKIKARGEEIRRRRGRRKRKTWVFLYYFPLFLNTD
jgi:hypothetical protein